MFPLILGPISDVPGRQLHDLIWESYLLLPELLCLYFNPFCETDPKLKLGPELPSTEKGGTSVLTIVLAALNNQVHPGGLQSRWLVLFRPEPSWPLSEILVKYRLFTVGLLISFWFFFFSLCWSSKCKLLSLHLQNSSISVILLLTIYNIP